MPELLALDDLDLLELGRRLEVRMTRSTALLHLPPFVRLGALPAGERHIKARSGHDFHGAEQHRALVAHFGKVTKS